MCVIHNRYTKACVDTFYKPKKKGPCVDVCSNGCILLRIHTGRPSLILPPPKKQPQGHKALLNPNKLAKPVLHTRLL